MYNYFRATADQRLLVVGGLLKKTFFRHEADDSLPSATHHRIAGTALSPGSGLTIRKLVAGPDRDLEGFAAHRRARSRTPVAVVRNLRRGLAMEHPRWPARGRRGGPRPVSPYQSLPPESRLYRARSCATALGQATHLRVVELLREKVSEGIRVGGEPQEASDRRGGECSGDGRVCRRSPPQALRANLLRASEVKPAHYAAGNCRARRVGRARVSACSGSPRSIRSGAERLCDEFGLPRDSSRMSHDRKRRRPGTPGRRRCWA